MSDESPEAKGRRRLELLMQLNPDFAKLVHQGNREAIVRADIVSSLDGGKGLLTGRKHPARALREDGKPHPFCNGCSEKEGCITCDLDDLPHDQMYRWENNLTGEIRYTPPPGDAGWARKRRNQMD